MSRHLGLALLVVAAATLGGCDFVKSSSVDTESIEAQILKLIWLFCGLRSNGIKRV